MKKLKIIAAIGLLVFVILIAVAALKTGYSKDDRTTVTLKLLKQTLELYKKDCSQYPDSLDALIQDNLEKCPTHKGGKFVRGGKLPLDGWANPFVYRSDGNTFQLFSVGHKELEITDKQDVGPKNDNNGS